MLVFLLHSMKLLFTKAIPPNPAPSKIIPIISETLYIYLIGFHLPHQSVPFQFQANRFVEKTYRRLYKLRLQDVIKQPWINTIFVADILLKAHLSAIQSPHNNPFPYPTFQTAFIVKALAIIHTTSDKFSVYRFQYQINQRNPLKFLHYMVFFTNLLFRL